MKRVVATVSTDNLFTFTFCATGDQVEALTVTHGNHPACFFLVKLSLAGRAAESEIEYTVCILDNLVSLQRVRLYTDRQSQASFTKRCCANLSPGQTR